MSRGPGKWQRAILAVLERRQCFYIADLGATRTQRQASQRALWELVEAGKVDVQRYSAGPKTVLVTRLGFPFVGRPCRGCNSIVGCSERAYHGTVPRTERIPELAQYVSDDTRRFRPLSSLSVIDIEALERRDWEVWRPRIEELAATRTIDELQTALVEEGFLLESWSDLTSLRQHLGRWETSYLLTDTHSRRLGPIESTLATLRRPAGTPPPNDRERVRELIRATRRDVERELRRGTHWRFRRVSD